MGLKKSRHPYLPSKESAASMTMLMNQTKSILSNHFKSEPQRSKPVDPELEIALPESDCDLNNKTLLLRSQHGLRCGTVAPWLISHILIPVGQCVGLWSCSFDLCCCGVADSTSQSLAGQPCSSTAVCHTRAPKGWHYRAYTQAS